MFKKRGEVVFLFYLFHKNRCFIPKKQNVRSILLNEYSDLTTLFHLMTCQFHLITKSFVEKKLPASPWENLGNAPEIHLQFLSFMCDY